MCDNKIYEVAQNLQKQRKELHQQIREFYKMFPQAAKSWDEIDFDENSHKIVDFFRHVFSKTQFDQESIKFAKYLGSIAYRDLKLPIGRIVFRCFEDMSDTLQYNMQHLICKWWVREGMKEDVAASSQGEIDVNEIFYTNTMIPNDIYVVFKKEKYPIPTLFVFREQNNMKKKTCVCSSCLEHCSTLKVVDTKLFSIMFEDIIDDCIISQLLSNICVGICAHSEFGGLVDFFQAQKVDLQTLINWLTDNIGEFGIMKTCESLFENYTSDILTNKFLHYTIKPCAVKFLRVATIHNDVHFISRVFFNNSICLKMNKNIMIVFDMSITEQYLNEIFEPLWKVMEMNKVISKADMLNAKGFTFAERIQNILAKARINSSKDIIKYTNCLSDSAEKYLNADDRQRAAEMLLHEIYEKDDKKQMSMSKRQRKRMRQKKAREAAVLCETEVFQEEEKEDEENMLKALKNKRRLLSMRKKFTKNRVICELSLFLRTHTIWKLRFELLEKEYKCMENKLNKLRNEVVCPITHEKFVDPVVADDGNTYEKQYIVNWLSLHSTSPLFGKNMNGNIVPNILVRNITALVS